MKMTANLLTHFPNPRFLENSGSDLSNERVWNPVGQFSLFSKLKQIVPEMEFEPQNSKVSWTIQGY